MSIRISPNIKKYSKKIDSISSKIIFTLSIEAKHKLVSSRESQEADNFFGIYQKTARLVYVNWRVTEIMPIYYYRKSTFILDPALIEHSMLLKNHRVLQNLQYTLMTILSVIHLI